jgi:cobalt-zinc-cadmium efflux system outer membrane protein
MRTAILTFAVWAGLSLGAAAQPVDLPTQLSLADALRLAEARSLRLAAAGNRVAIVEADHVDASRRPNPAISVESEGYPLLESSRPSFFNTQEFTVRFDQEIEMAGRRRLRREAADEAVAAGRARFADERRRLQFDVRRAYFQVVLAKADLDVARGALSEVDRSLTLSRARLGEGEISGADVRRLQVERLRFVDDVFAGELALRNARSALLALLNVPDLDRAFDVSEPLAAPTDAATMLVAAVGLTGQADIGVLEAQAIAGRPDLAAARRETERAATETRLQRALRTPNVTVGGGYRRDFGANAVVFGVTVPLPLFNSLNPGGVARADAAQQLAKNEEVLADLTVRLDVQQAVNAVDVSRERVEYIEREHLENARQSLAIIRASYDLGAADLIDFLDAQRAFRDTQRIHNRALYDLRVSVFELAAAVGNPAL